MGTLTNRLADFVEWKSAALDEIAFPVTGEVHLWLISISSNLNRIDELKGLLNADELTRGGKYRQQRDQQRFIISRGVQRVILGRYVDRTAESLTFDLGPNKKPFLSVDSRELHYNVSHSGNCIVLAVSLSAVGADVELIDDSFVFDDILADNFSAEEISFINGQDRVNRFYLLWTRKEAFLKATGQGLGDHLQVTPSLDGINLLNDTLSHANTNWSQLSFKIDENYIATVAAAGKWELKAFKLSSL